jgi:hypothetical protein
LIPTEAGLQNPPTFISLGHELAHAEDHFKASLNTSKTWRSQGILRQKNTPPIERIKLEAN